MSTLGSDSLEEIRDLLNRYLSGETNAEEDERVRELLAANSDAAAELHQMELARTLLRRAVDAEPVPGSLRGAVRSATVDAVEDAGAEIDFGLASVIASPHSAGERSFRRYYLVAAVLLLFVSVWFALRQSEGDEDSGRLAETVDTAMRNSDADSVDPVREILRIGMADHLKCAVAYYRKSGGKMREGGVEEMRVELGKEFAGLIPVVQEKIAEGKLLAAHRCAFGGRKYVHIIVVGKGRLISVAVTHREKGESLAGHRGSAVTPANVPVYRAAMDGFEVAGFESGEFLVFVASDLPEKTNLQVALNVADPVSRVLGEVEGVL